MCAGSSSGSWWEPSWPRLAAGSLLCALLWLVVPASAQASTDIEPPSPLTTSTESFVSTTLRPLVEQALTQSEGSDQTLSELQQQIEADRRQKIADDKQRKSEAEQRQKEQQDSALAYKTLSDRVAPLQNFSDALLGRLTDFSGSEDQKQAAALAALDGIQAKAKALETENLILKIGTAILGAAAAGLGIWAAVK